MKFHKALALALAFAMVVAAFPAFAASSDDVTSVIMSDGKTVYAVDGSNLIADGSFETDDWESQLTTGNFSYQNPGKYNSATSNLQLSDMNQDTYLLRRGVTAFERVAGEGVDGGYAIVAITDKVTRTTNGANGPTSIKNYIQNDTGATQKYYVSFAAKAVSDETSFYYMVDAVTENGYLTDNSGYPTGTELAVNADGYTVVDAAIDVPADEYLLINIYDMAANSVYLDGFKVYKIYESEDSSSFTQVMTQWETLFPYEDGQTVETDLELPATVGSATVEWTSSNPEIIDAETGKLTAPIEDGEATLSAKITAGEFAAEKTYTFKVPGWKDKVIAAIDSSVPASVIEDVELISTVEGYEGSVVAWTSSNPELISNDGKYTDTETKTRVTLTATVTYDGTTFTRDIVVTAGKLDSGVVPNGGFETDDLSGWTSRLGGEIEGAEIVYDEELGANALHMEATEGKTSAKSVGTKWTVEAGKTYVLSFDIKLDSLITTDNYRYSKVTDAVGTSDGADSTDVAGNEIVGIGSSVTEVNTWTHVEKEFEAATDTVYFLYFQLSWTGAVSIANVKLLEQIDNADFTTSVTINYLDKATGSAIKDARVVENLSGASDGSRSYSAKASDKEDVTTEDGSYYTYDETSVDSVVLTNGENVINLYFNEFVDDADNIVPNGNFEIDDLSGWTSRLGGAVSGASIVYDDTIGANTLYMSETKGKNAQSVGTAWTVETGKTYTISFDIKLAEAIASNNYVYNKVTDAVGTADDGTSRDVGGNELIDLGTTVTTTDWTHVEKTFVAATDTVYFQLSWTSAVSLANVSLKETAVSSIVISDGKAIVSAVDETVEGKLVVVQYADGAQVSVVTGDISVAAGEKYEAEITATEGATSVRVMVLKSLESLVPVLKSADAKLG